MTRPAADVRFVEYRLGAGVLALRVVADVLTTVAVASGAAFALALLPLVGVVDESALGARNHRAVDDWSRTWVGIAVGAGFVGVGLLAVAFLGAAGAATRAALRRESEQPGADRLVPVRQQRATLAKDPWEALHSVSRVLGLTIGVVFVFAAAYTGKAFADDDDDASSILLAAVVLGAAAAVLLLAFLATRPRPPVTTPGTQVWTGSAASLAARAAKTDRGQQRNEPATRLDRVVRVLVGRAGKIMVGLAVAWAIAGFVMVVVRKPGRFASPRHFSDPVEDGIDVIWRCLVVAGFVLIVLAVLGWVTVLVLDIVRLSGLARRVRRGDTATRPCTQALRRGLRLPGASGRLGRSLVAAATALGSATWSMALVDRGPRAVVDGGLLVAGLLAVAGVAATAAGYSWESTLRNAVRSAWPVTDGPADGADGKSASASGSRPGRRGLTRKAGALQPK